jgi:hypothetical protein
MKQKTGLRETRRCIQEIPRASHKNSVQRENVFNLTFRYENLHETSNDEE